MSSLHCDTVPEKNGDFNINPNKYSDKIYLLAPKLIWFLCMGFCSLSLYQTTPNRGVGGTRALAHSINTLTLHEP